MRRTKEAPPGGYGSWKEFYSAKKEKKALKAEQLLERLRTEKENEKAEHLIEQIPQVIQGEISTLSIAVPGSILDNAQSVELRTYLAGQIARAACVFKVDEVIVYDDVGVQDSLAIKTLPSASDDGELHLARRCCAQLARILQFLECPQYLRKDFFPKCKDLEYAGLLNPLDAPHHMRQQDESQFREGVVLKIPAKNGSYVNVGLLDKVKVDKILQPGLRVTVEMLPPPCPTSKRPFGRVVSPSTPHQVSGVYWGYSVRLANSLSAVMTGCPYQGGYDLTIGTSERGDPVETASLPSSKHALIVFGGLAGLEAALEADEVLTETNPAFLFDHYLNTCFGQGSRTIRTEEAILITLSALRTRIKPLLSVSQDDQKLFLKNVEGNSNKKDPSRDDHDQSDICMENLSTGPVLNKSGKKVRIKNVIDAGRVDKSDEINRKIRDVETPDRVVEPIVMKLKKKKRDKSKNDESFSCNDVDKSQKKKMKSSHFNESHELL